MRDIEPPGIGSNEVLVRVEVCVICHTDLKTQTDTVPTVRPPRIIEPEIGREVSNVKEGDNVVLYPYRTCLNFENVICDTS